MKAGLHEDFRVGGGGGKLAMVGRGVSVASKDFETVSGHATSIRRVRWGRF